MAGKLPTVCKTKRNLKYVIALKNEELVTGERNLPTWYAYQDRLYNLK